MKLIRELRAENARLKALLGDTVVSATVQCLLSYQYYTCTSVAVSLCMPLIIMYEVC